MAERALTTEGSIAAALLLHFALISAVFIDWQPWGKTSTESFGSAAQDMSIVFVTPPQTQPAHTAGPIIDNAATPQKMTTSNTKQQRATSTQRTRQTQHARGSTEQLRGSAHGNRTLGVIRQQLVRARHFPRSAQRARIEGKPIVRFAINTDGSVATATVVKSSGHITLDQAALETVHRAAPFPYYDQPITVPISYALR